MPETPPKAPSHLGRQSKTLWDSIVSRYEFEDEELATLALALEAMDIARVARRRLKRDGQFVPDRFGQLKPHPAVTIHRDALASWSRLTTQLGIPTDPDQEPGRTNARRGNG